MTHDEILLSLQKETGVEWECIPFRQADLLRMTMHEKKPVLVLTDDNKVTKTYISKKNYDLYPLKVNGRLKLALERSGIKKLIPTIVFNMNNFPKITISSTTPTRQRITLTVLTSGNITLQAINTHNQLLYNLSGKLSSQMQANNALNQFITDITTYNVELDLKNNQANLLTTKKLRVLGSEIKLKMVNFNTFKGSIGLSLKREEVIYQGWKLTGDLSLDITLSIDNNTPDLAKSPEYLGHPQKYSLVNNHILTYGGLFVLVGSTCFIAPVYCGIGAITLAAS